MNDEPLEEWADRRDRRRPRVGEWRTVPFGNDAGRGAHVDPDAPRAVQVWNGHQWVPEGVAEDYSATVQEIGEDMSSRAERVDLPTSGRLPTAPEPYRPTIPFYRPNHRS
ncbi:DUF6087 family protein [Streptomyces sp. NBC_01335]|uniref:DUF6087 family protein n=1 Tax=Streptomyces sp. NBC_01335 TaxID=2903828 RepID=UPI003FA34C77